MNIAAAAIIELFWRSYCYCYNFRNVNESIRTWKLAYLPKNAVFDDIMDDVTKSLALDGFISVQSAKDLGNVLFSQQLVAGIEFHHPAVRLTLSHIYAVIYAVFSIFSFRIRVFPKCRNNFRTRFVFQMICVQAGVRG